MIIQMSTGRFYIRIRNWVHENKNAILGFIGTVAMYGIIMDGSYYAAILLILVILISKFQDRIRNFIILRRGLYTLTVLILLISAFFFTSFFVYIPFTILLFFHALYSVSFQAVVYISLAFTGYKLGELCLDAINDFSKKVSSKT